MTYFQDFLLVATAAIAVASVPEVAASETHLRSPSAQQHLLTGSTTPTECYTISPPKFVASLCMVDGEKIETIEDQWPAERSHSIVVNNQYESYVEFTITSLMQDDVGIAVRHTDLDLENSCRVFQDSSLGNFVDFQAKCIEEFTSVMIVVNEDPENVDPDEDWKACNMDDIRKRRGQFCAYRVEIPCKQMRVDCEDLNAGVSIKK